MSALSSLLCDLRRQHVLPRVAEPRGLLLEERRQDVKNSGVVSIGVTAPLWRQFRVELVRVAVRWRALLHLHLGPKSIHAEARPTPNDPTDPSDLCGLTSAFPATALYTRKRPRG